MYFNSTTCLTWYATSRLITNPLWRRNDGSTTPLAEPWRTWYDQYHCEETHTKFDERTACDPTWARLCDSGWKGLALLYLWSQKVMGHVSWCVMKLMVVENIWVYIPTPSSVLSTTWRRIRLLTLNMTLLPKTDSSALSKLGNLFVKQAVCLESKSPPSMCPVTFCDHEYRNWRWKVGGILNTNSCATGVQQTPGHICSWPSNSMETNHSGSHTNQGTGR